MVQAHSTEREREMLRGAHRHTNTQRRRDAETQRHTETHRNTQKHTETQRRRDAETQRHPHLFES